MGRFFVLKINESIEYVKYLAWMNAVPKGKEEPRGKGATLHEPPWLVEVAMDCGLSAQTGFGPAVITWQEIKAWQDVTGQRGIWLAQIIRGLSTVFVSWLDKAADPSCPMPAEEHQPNAVIDQVKKFIASRR